LKKFLLEGGEIEPYENVEEAEKKKAEILNKEKKIEENLLRDALLKKGTLTADGRIWFNYDTAQMFISAFVTLDEDETLLWRDANRDVIELTYVEAKAYTKEIRAVLQALYGLK
jgi:hypothetical protein